MRAGRKYYGDGMNPATWLPACQASCMLLFLKKRGLLVRDRGWLGVRTMRTNDIVSYN
jgi:hypothetical protein